MSSKSLIPPHGGTLVNRLIDPAKARSFAAEAASLPSITLSTTEACDLEMIAIGAFSPLTGFVGKADFEAICLDIRLSDGTVWPIPITLAVDESVKAGLEVGGRAALHHPDGTLLAVITINEIYPHDRALEIPNVYGTEDSAHPGVQAVLDSGEWLVAGPIDVIP